MLNRYVAIYNLKSSVVTIIIEYGIVGVGVAAPQ
jgi:hypothetical protein